MNHLQKTRSVCFGLLLVFCTLCCIACAKEKETPEAFFESYMEAFQTDLNEASQYVYFANPATIPLYQGSETDVSDYSVEKVEQVNDNLTAITYTITEIGTGKKDRTVNFVAVMDGEYRMILNVQSIPEALREGLVFENYTIPDYLDSSDVILPTGN